MLLSCKGHFLAGSGDLKVAVDAFTNALVPVASCGFAYLLTTQQLCAADKQHCNASMNGMLSSELGCMALQASDDHQGTDETNCI